MFVIWYKGTEQFNTRFILLYVMNNADWRNVNTNAHFPKGRQQKKPPFPGAFAWSGVIQMTLST